MNDTPPPPPAPAGATQHTAYWIPTSTEAPQRHAFRRHPATITPGTLIRAVCGHETPAPTRIPAHHVPAIPAEPARCPHCQHRVQHHQLWTFDWTLTTSDHTPTPADTEAPSSAPASPPRPQRRTPCPPHRGTRPSPTHQRSRGGPR